MASVCFCFVDISFGARDSIALGVFMFCFVVTAFDPHYFCLFSQDWGHLYDSLLDFFFAMVGCQMLKMIASLYSGGRAPRSEFSDWPAQQKTAKIRIRPSKFIVN
ncbi:hypothetical protein FN846DRAFT_555660 [Sphaerosporella brunnea]|uniref:Uncharacterized protein n=1 Tax=Sphaerosporella brunnea TaxID=1250544 RepID=A0A5J5ECC1_9PEZI|nr:hypothetical protein FN846DRAFT_555660 [Sphaerosporella brunnea]